MQTVLAAPVDVAPVDTSTREERLREADLRAAFGASAALVVLLEHADCRDLSLKALDLRQRIANTIAQRT